MNALQLIKCSIEYNNHKSEVIASLHTTKYCVCDNCLKLILSSTQAADGSGDMMYCSLV